ncbi:MAG: pentapeptide repeat-containing protein [Phormidesmis sp.]
MLGKLEKNVRGQRFEQTSVTRELRDIVAGQRLARKIALLLVLVTVGIVLSIMSSVVVTIGSVELVAGVGDTGLNQWMLNILSVTTLVAWLLVTVYFGTQKGRLVVGVGTGITAIIGILLTSNGAIKDDLFLIAAITTVLVYWLICNLFLSFSRFTLAIFDVLFDTAKLARSAWFIAVTLGSILGASVGASPEISADMSGLIHLIGMSSGIVFTVLLAVSGWWCNRCQNIPWRSPEVMRSWALTLGAWGGTSFYGLDLSEVDFQGAKLQNTDLRAHKLNRTRLQGVKGLSRARVDNKCLDLEDLRVQKLLTHGCSQTKDFRGLNLQGAYLQAADMRDFDLTDTKLSGADFKHADLRGSTLVRTQLAGADFRGVDLRNNNLTDANLTGTDFRESDLRGSILIRAQIAQADFTHADLTGICIEDWSVSNTTSFKDARCDYVYKKYAAGQPTERYPSDRDFEAGEFAALFQQPADLIELIFKGDLDYNALSLAFYKLEAEAPELQIKIKGIEQRGSLWVVKVSSPNQVTESTITERLTLYDHVPASSATASHAIESAVKDSIYKEYEETKSRLEASEQLVQQLAGVTSSQAEALKEFSKRSFGNNFFITGSTITNLAGSGEIDYTEAAGQVRNLIDPSSSATQAADTMQTLLARLQTLNIATTPDAQAELIQQLVLSEAQKDPAFAALLVQENRQIMAALPAGSVASAVQNVIASLSKAT